MSWHKTYCMRRILALSLLLKSTQSRIFQPTNLRLYQLAESSIASKQNFSSTPVFNSEMANCGAGDSECVMSYDQLLEAQKDAGFLIIDVREHSEVNKTGALPGSIHIPMKEVANELTNLSNEKFSEKYSRDLPSKDTKLVFSCMSGKRSSMVYDLAKKLGFKNVYNFKGGWSEWDQKQKHN